MGFEDRKLLPGHKSDHVTTHYSAPEIGALIDASEKVCELGSRKSAALAILRLQRQAEVTDLINGKRRDSNPRPRIYESGRSKKCVVVSITCQGRRLQLAPRSATERD